jgi:D-serine deaminase-like pyridoxal phosphate-dependent protein
MNCFDKKNYALENTEDLVSPALIYYRDIILDNTKRIIRMAGGAERLWPHVKSHKAAELIRMQINLGIKRFKCATIAEAETAAREGAPYIALAYPLVGPNIGRYLRLAAAFPKTVFYAIGDDYDALSALSRQAEKTGTRMAVLVDVDLGMHRTGIPVDALEAFYEKCASLPGIILSGLHCYDGHLHQEDPLERKSAVDAIDREVQRVLSSLKAKGLSCDTLIMGGSPTFPCRAGGGDCFLSPGTIFIGDWNYYKNLPDLAFTPGAAVFTRVVSHPAPHAFTLDLGYKGIASDQEGQRGIIVGMEDAEPAGHSEEHWVFKRAEGKEIPPLGEACYVLPAHICPTTALYPVIQLASGGKITGICDVTARNRKLEF